MDKPEQKMLPYGYESVSYLNFSDKNNNYELIKSEEYDVIIPSIFSSIDTCKSKICKTYNYPYFIPENSLHYLPKLDKESEILSIVQLKQLHSNFPDYHKYSNLKLHYSISIHGTLLKSFYNKCLSENINNSLLVIKDEQKNIFGAYASEMFFPNRKFSGTSECFLFTFYKDNIIHVFNATEKNEYYMYCDDNQICFGCSDDYFSLCLCNNFLEGYSKKTQTYDNECLTNSDKFTIYKLELWGFD